MMDVESSLLANIEVQADAAFAATEATFETDAAPVDTAPIIGGLGGLVRHIIYKAAYIHIINNRYTVI